MHRRRCHHHKKSSNSRSLDESRNFLEFKTENHDSNFKILHESESRVESREIRKGNGESMIQLTVCSKVFFSSTKFIHRLTSNWTHRIDTTLLFSLLNDSLFEKKKRVNPNEVLTSGVDSNKNLIPQVVLPRHLLRRNDR